MTAEDLYDALPREANGYPLRDAVIELIEQQRWRYVEVADRVREKGNGITSDDAAWREACRQVIQAIVDA